MNKYAQAILDNQYSLEHELIKLSMPDDATLSRTSSIQYGNNGKRVYSFGNNNFLEISPREINSVKNDDGYTISISASYRIIK